MTFNGVMGLFCVISPNLVASGVHCVKVVEDVIIKKFMFTISSPDEFLVEISKQTDRDRDHNTSHMILQTSHCAQSAMTTESQAPSVTRWQHA